MNPSSTLRKKSPTRSEIVETENNTLRRRSPFRPEIVDTENNTLRRRSPTRSENNIERRPSITSEHFSTVS